MARLRSENHAVGKIAGPSITSCKFDVTLEHAYHKMRLHAIPCVITVTVRRSPSGQRRGGGAVRMHADVYVAIQAVTRSLGSVTVPGFAIARRVASAR